MACRRHGFKPRASRVIGAAPLAPVDATGLFSLQATRTAYVNALNARLYSVVAVIGLSGTALTLVCYALELTRGGSPAKGCLHSGICRTTLPTPCPSLLACTTASEADHHV